MGLLSHTVGLELIAVRESPYNAYARESPSHTVGLNHLSKSFEIRVLTLSKLRQPTGRAH